MSLAWGASETENGDPDLATLRRTIAQPRRPTPPSERDDPVIGCRVPTGPFLWPEELWLPAPATLSANTVTGKGYGADEPEGLRPWRAVWERLSATPRAPRAAPPAAQAVPAVPCERHGAPTLPQRRLGQDAFRRAVTDGYGRRRAVSGERTLSILDAAHVRPCAEEGGREAANGLLLRTDIRCLFDLGRAR